jgi:hypothetical protein
MPLSVEQAYELGKKAKGKGAHRVPPFYEEIERKNGMKLDVTVALN